MQDDKVNWNLIQASTSAFSCSKHDLFSKEDGTNLVDNNMGAAGQLNPNRSYAGLEQMTDLVDDDVGAAGLLQATDGLAAAADDAADDARRALHVLGHVAGRRAAGLGDEPVDLRHRLLHQVWRGAADRDGLQVARRRVVDLQVVQQGRPSGGASTTELNR